MRYGAPWIVEREKYRLTDDGVWRVWFAWYPVRLIDGTGAWWEYVEYNRPMRYLLPTYRARR